jgi:hypothetical protein
MRERSSGDKIGQRAHKVPQLSQSIEIATVTFSNKEPSMAEQKAKKKSTIETVREIAQAIFPRAKKRQARRIKRREGIKKALGIKSKK